MKNTNSARYRSAFSGFLAGCLRSHFGSSHFGSSLKLILARVLFAYSLTPCCFTCLFGRSHLCVSLFMAPLVIATPSGVKLFINDVSLARDIVQEYLHPQSQKSSRSTTSTEVSTSISQVASVDGVPSHDLHQSGNRAGSHLNQSGHNLIGSGQIMGNSRSVEKGSYSDVVHPTATSTKKKRRSSWPSCNTGSSSSPPDHHQLTWSVLRNNLSALRQSGSPSHQSPTRTATRSSASSLVSPKSDRHKSACDENNSMDGPSSSANSRGAASVNRFAPLATDSDDDDDSKDDPDVPNCPECHAQLQLWCENCEDFFGYGD